MRVFRSLAPMPLIAFALACGDDALDEPNVDSGGADVGTDADPATDVVDTVDAASADTADALPDDTTADVPPDTVEIDAALDTVGEDIVVPTADEVWAEIDPGAPLLRRLTEEQFENALRDVLGDNLIIPGNIEPDFESDGLLAIGASLTAYSQRGTERLEAAAFDIAEQVVGDAELREEIGGCAMAAPDDAACASTWVANTGRRLWRRPLTDEEVTQYATIATTAGTTLGDGWTGISFALAGLIQSPNFLYRVELGEPDPAHEGMRRLTSIEFASRLSFFLWNTTPDDALLEAAIAGELVTDEGLSAQVERMIGDDRVRDGVRRFFTELYRLYRLDELSKDPNIFVHMNEEVGRSAREETLQTIEQLVFTENADFRDLMTTRTTFLNRTLAAIYNVRAPAREGFARVDYDENSLRVGLLGQVSVLALNSHPVSSSATLRGIFVREVLLCQEMAPPPAGVDTSIPEPSGTTRTLRERVAEHLEVESCASCHRLVDPIGLGLENFDGIGRFRLTDNDEEIDPTGELDGVSFTSPVELAEAIAARPEFVDCVAEQLFRYAVGRRNGRGDRAALSAIDAEFAVEGFRIIPLLRVVALSPAFRAIGEVE